MTKYHDILQALMEALEPDALDQTANDLPGLRCVGMAASLHGMAEHQRAALTSARAHLEANPSDPPLPGAQLDAGDLMRDYNPNRVIQSVATGDHSDLDRAWRAVKNMEGIPIQDAAYHPFVRQGYARAQSEALAAIEALGGRDRGDGE